MKIVLIYTINPIKIVQVKFIRVSNTSDMGQIHLETLTNDFLDTLSAQTKVYNVTISQVGNSIVSVVLYDLNGV